MKKFVFSRMSISMPLAILAAAILIFINEASFHESTSATANIQEAQRSRTAVNKLLQNMLDAETGQRGYLLTGDLRYLKPYNVAVEETGQNLDNLRLFLTPYKEQLAELNALSRSISEKMAEMDLTVKMRREGREDAWKFVITTDVGEEQMQLIRQQAMRLTEINTQKMEIGQEQIRKILQISRIGVTITALAGVLAFYMYLLQTKALLASGHKEQETLQHERDQLGLQVMERTATLAELATHLQNVREDERGHLARELHDELGALLTAAKLDVARIKSRLGSNYPEATERLEHLTSTLNSGIALKRRIVEDLHPSSLSHLGLVASLEILAREFQERSGLVISTNLEHVELNSSSQLTIYRLVQESLTNISKYANAKKVCVKLESTDGYAIVEVVDDGRGFNISEVGAGSYGLTGMRHRVEAISGKLTVSSAEGRGARIMAVVPTLS